eukprot:COSAG05_NODE_105_length_18793_cov_115.346421_12_plen_120_part_00
MTAFYRIASCIRWCSSGACIDYRGWRRYDEWKLVDGVCTPPPDMMMPAAESTDTGSVYQRKILQPGESVDLAGVAKGSHAAGAAASESLQPGSSLATTGDEGVTYSDDDNSAPLRLRVD